MPKTSKKRDTERKEWNERPFKKIKWREIARGSRKGVRGRVKMKWREGENEETQTFVRKAHKSGAILRFSFFNNHPLLRVRSSVCPFVCVKCRLSMCPSFRFYSLRSSFVLQKYLRWKSAFWYSRLRWALGNEEVNKNFANYVLNDLHLSVLQFWQNGTWGSRRRRRRTNSPLLVVVLITKQLVAIICCTILWLTGFA